MFATLEGETSPTSLEATTREVIGDTKGAFVALGSATRLMAADSGFGMLFDTKLGGSVILDLGVTGIGPEPLVWARRLVGVDGATVSVSVDDGTAFLFLPVELAVGAGKGTGALSSAWARSLADRRVVISGNVTLLSRYQTSSFVPPGDRSCETRWLCE